MKEESSFMMFERESYPVRNIQQGEPLWNLVLKFIKEGPILDVGCGCGDFLVWLRDKFGVECYGIDPSSYAVRISKSKGLDVSESSIDSFSPKRKFKTILMIGVVAHLYYPKRDLKKVLSWLDKDGRLILVFPNGSSPFLKKQHLHFYLPKFLGFRKFLKQNQFRIIKCLGAGRLRYFPYLSSHTFYVVGRIGGHKEAR